MPARSQKQLKYIYAMRNKYGSKKKAPKKYKWLFGKEWGHMERLMNFNSFCESKNL